MRPFTRLRFVLVIPKREPLGRRTLKINATLPYGDTDENFAESRHRSPHDDLNDRGFAGVTNKVTCEKQTNLDD
ncbi:MAG: hypothetical protein ACI9HK_002611 [Pirellulaceae bacterium]|jgi:hypothetical protein